jgi:FKBP-type peptidyl-prolyl cis-trans isomerase SlyD
MKPTLTVSSGYFLFYRRIQMNIADKMYVAIEYTLTLESGQEIDKSPADQPLGFITGTGQIIPGLEKALMGRATGDNAKLIIAPEDAYGPVKDDLFQDIPKSQFPNDVEVKPGMAFEAQGPRGPFMITVAQVNDNDTVTVDLNHPMAGKQLHFDVNVIDVREPTADELAQAAASLSAGCGCGCGPDEADSADSTAACGTGCNCG